MPDISRNVKEKLAIKIIARKWQDEREVLEKEVQRGLLLILRKQAA